MYTPILVLLEIEISLGLNYLLLSHARILWKAIIRLIIAKVNF